MSLTSWIKCGNECEVCKWHLDDSSSTENGEEYDFGCLIKGDMFDEYPCRLINPYKWILGTLKRKRHDYFYRHKFDDYIAWNKNYEEKNSAYARQITDSLTGDVVWYSQSGKLDAKKFEELVMGRACEMRTKYDEKVHPNKRLKLREEWKILLIKTFKAFVESIKPYISE